MMQGETGKWEKKPLEFQTLCEIPWVTKMMYNFPFTDITLD